MVTDDNAMRDYRSRNGDRLGTKAEEEVVDEGRARGAMDARDGEDSLCLRWSGRFRSHCHREQVRDVAWVRVVTGED